MREAVDAYIQEAAHHQTDDGEQNYQAYVHGCLLWTYDRSEVNSSFVPLAGITCTIIPSSLPSAVAKGKALKQAHCEKEAGSASLTHLSLRVPACRDVAISLWSNSPVLDGLPAQEGIGHSINDVPDVDRVGLV